MSADPEISWDDVLADCESVTAHAEALLRSRRQTHLRPVPPPISPLDYPARLPDPSPSQLRRLTALRTRQQNLAGALAQAMRNLEQQHQLLSEGPLTHRPSVYIDRRM